MSMSDWLRSQPKDAQERVLGVKRAQWFREGRLDNLNPDLLLDANNRALPLDQLQTKLERAGRL